MAPEWIKPMMGVSDQSKGKWFDSWRVKFTFNVLVARNIRRTISWPRVFQIDLKVVLSSTERLSKLCYSREHWLHLSKSSNDSEETRRDPFWSSPPRLTPSTKQRPPSPQLMAWSCRPHPTASSPHSGSWTRTHTNRSTWISRDKHTTRIAIGISSDATGEGP